MNPIAEPSLDGNEARHLRGCLGGGYFSSTGPFVERFDHELVGAIGTYHAVVQQETVINALKDIFG